MNLHLTKLVPSRSKQFKENLAKTGSSKITVRLKQMDDITEIASMFFTD